MKTIFGFIFLALMLGGCSTNSVGTTGGYFSTDNVDSIVKGETTAEEIVKLFGQPFQKSLISANEERWNYYHHRITVNGSIFTGMNTGGQRKSLDVLLIDGIVVNYAFTDSDTGYNINTQ